MDLRIEELKKISFEFGQTAKKVNESSLKRKQRAEEVIILIDDSLDIGNDLASGIQFVADSNISWRDQDTSILSICSILHSNIQKQNIFLQEIESNGFIEKDKINQIKDITANLETAIDQVQQNVSNVIGKDHDIILLDHLLLSKKKHQQNDIKSLKRLALSVLDDAENAIAGSASNMKRSMDMVEKIMNLDVMISSNKKEDIEMLIIEAYTGWNIATEVNASSKSQYEFSSSVNEYTKQFYQDSMSIKDLVVKKHKIFEENLQIITVYTVILSMDFKKYLAIEEIVKSIPDKTEIRSIINDYKILVDIACTDIQEITKLNLDMTEISHLNNEIETKTVEWTELEIKKFDAIRNMVQEMTEITAYPVEGSSKNIDNVKKIEMMLKDISGITDVDYKKTVKIEPKISDQKTQGLKLIMIIDDSSAIRQVVNKILSTAKYAVVEADDGAAALKLLDGRKLDLILCDVNMPNVNGIEFLQAVKNDQKYAAYRFTPIIMLTTEAGESMKEKGKELGARAWMVKPFQPATLLEKIKPLIG